MQLSGSVPDGAHSEAMAGAVPREVLAWEARLPKVRLGEAREVGQRVVLLEQKAPTSIGYAQALVRLRPVADLPGQLGVPAGP